MRTEKCDKRSSIKYEILKFKIDISLVFDLFFILILIGFSFISIVYYINISPEPTAEYLAKNPTAQTKKTHINQQEDLF